jgi:hypothetical protein
MIVTVLVTFVVRMIVTPLVMLVSLLRAPRPRKVKIPDIHTVFASFISESSVVSHHKG